MFPRIAVSLVIAAAALATAWLGFFFFRDNFSSTYPFKVVAAEAFRSGEIPYWTGLYNGGQPLAANPGTLSFYPTNVLYLFFPAHVAFNLHYLIHLAAAGVAMRALCLARGTSREAALFAGVVYALSGVVISSTALYNHIVNVAMIPIALLGVERRSAPLLGTPIGLMALAAEPVTLLGTAITLAIAAWRRLSIRTIAAGGCLSFLVASPVLIAFTEISGDLARTLGMAPQNVLATALSPLRIAEIFVWPLSGFLNDPGGGEARMRMFSTIFVGLIGIPALFRRSRYVAIVLVMLFLAAQNPIVTAAVVRFEWLRFGRYPEKFVIPLTAALVVLIGEYFHRTRFRKAWLIVTLVPLVWSAYRALPIDWVSHYRIPDGVTPGRVFHRPDPRDGVRPARVEYRERARNLEPFFGMAAGVGYLMMTPPDSMTSRLTQVVNARFHSGPDERKLRYLQIAGARVPGALPMAMIVPRTIRARSLREAVQLVESPQLDPRAVAVAPFAIVSAPARITRYVEDGQTFVIDVEAEGRALLLINQTFYGAWDATMNGEPLPTMSLYVDRLGIVVPGSGRVELRFGHRRIAIAVAAALSLLLVVATFAIEIRERRAGKIERADDHD